jgi:hypothetical protein
MSERRVIGLADHASCRAIPFVQSAENTRENRAENASTRSEAWQSPRSLSRSRARGGAETACAAGLPACVLTVAGPSLPARVGRQRPGLAARRRRRPGGRGPVCAVVPGQVRVVRQPSLAIEAVTHGRPCQSDPRRSGICAEVGEGLDVFGKCGGADLGQITLTGTFTLIPPAVDITAEISACMRRFQRTASVITSLEETQRTRARRHHGRSRSARVHQSGLTLTASDSAPLPTPRGRGSPGRCRGSRHSAIPRRGSAPGWLQPRWRSPDRSRSRSARG